MNTFPDNNRSFADTALTDTIFSLIRTLLEPQAFIHIGAGTGQGNMHFWRQWNLPDALIIEADETRLTWAQKACESNPAWHVVNTVIGSREGEALFFQATNPDEDGLTAPDRLTQLWPNLRQTGQNTRTIQRLDELLKAPAYQSLTQAQNRWLIIDCFPALEIIQGATESLNHTDVICVRIIKEALNNTKADMDIQAITDFLAPLNYRQSAIIESNHPAVGHAVFTRNISVLRSELTTLSDDYSQLNKKLDEQNRLIQDRLATIQRLETERDNQAKTAAERQQHIEQLTLQRDEQGQHTQALQKQIEQIQTERDNQAKTAAERQQQIEQLSQQRDEQGQHSQALQKQIEQIQTERDNQAKTAAERQQQIEQLTQQRDEQGQHSQALQKQLQALTQEKTELTKQNDRLQQEKAASNKRLDELNEKITTLEKALSENQQHLKQSEQAQKEKEQRVAQLETEIQEHRQRQQLVDNEMLKAEAQIELIKDLLLRDTGL